MNRKIVLLMILGTLFLGFNAEIALKVALDTGVVTERKLSATKEAVTDKLNSVPKGSDILRKIPDLIIEGCTEENTKGHPIRICVPAETAGAKSDETLIQFISPEEESTLTLSGIELKDEKEVDVTQYFTTFVDHYEKLVKDEDKAALIAKVVSEFKHEGQALVIEDQDFAKGASTKTHVSYGDKDPKHGFDLEWENNTATFKTSYFENSLTLTITNKEMIEEQVKKTVESVVTHLDRTNNFVLDHGEETQALKDMTCEKILGAGSPIFVFEKKLVGSKVTQGQPAPENSVQGTIEYNGKVIKVSCNSAGGTGDAILLVTIQLPEKFHSIVQPFFKQSLYNLKPIVESFFEDIALLASKLFGPAKAALPE